MSDVSRAYARSPTGSNPAVRIGPITPGEAETTPLARQRGSGQVRITGVSTMEAIAEELVHAILGGRIQPGSFLREIDLAQRYGVSRQSMHSAMVELHHDGILQHEAHRGFWVPRLAAEDVDEIFEIRRLIECDAARKLAGRRDSLEASTAVLDRIRFVASDVERSTQYELHFQFHRSLVSAAEPSRLARYYDMLSAETWLLLISGNIPVEPRLSRLNRTHEEIVDAVRSGDPDLAVECTARHLDFGHQQALNSLAENPWRAANP